MRFYLLAAAILAVAYAAGKKEYAPPVAILKQIDKHNDDGSYSYGYEAADGTFKIETKYPDGEVYGKYGYIDDTGTVREVEYGASRRGFEPIGNEIQVAPPTLRDSQAAPPKPLAPNEEDDGQYREDPAMYYKDDPYAQASPQQPQQRAYQPPSKYQPSTRYQRPQSFYTEPEYEPVYEPEPYRPIVKPETTYKPAYKPQTSYRPQPSFRPQSYYAPEPEPEYRPVYRPDPPRSYYQPQPQPRPQPVYRPQSNFGFSNDNNYYNPPAYNNNYNNPPSYNNYGGPSWQGHPATNVDINTGSYSVNYKR